VPVSYGTGSLLSTISYYRSIPFSSLLHHFLVSHLTHIPFQDHTSTVQYRTCIACLYHFHTRVRSVDHDTPSLDTQRATPFLIFIISIPLVISNPILHTSTGTVPYWCFEKFNGYHTITFLAAHYLPCPYRWCPDC